MLPNGKQEHFFSSNRIIIKKKIRCSYCSVCRIEILARTYYVWKWNIKKVSSSKMNKWMKKKLWVCEFGLLSWVSTEEEGSKENGLTWSTWTYLYEFEFKIWKWKIVVVRVVRIFLFFFLLATSYTNMQLCVVIVECWILFISFLAHSNRDSITPYKSINHIFFCYLLLYAWRFQFKDYYEYQIWIFVFLTWQVLFVEWSFLDRITKINTNKRSFLVVVD